MDLSDIVRLDAEEVVAILRANNLPTDGLESEQRERLINYSYGNVIHRLNDDERARLSVDFAPLQLASKRVNTGRSRAEDKSKQQQSSQDADRVLKEFSASFQVNEYEYTTSDGRKQRMKGFVRGDVLAPSSSSSSDANVNDTKQQQQQQPTITVKQESQQTPIRSSQNQPQQTLANLFEKPSSSSSSMASVASSANNIFASYDNDSNDNAVATAAATPVEVRHTAKKSSSSSKKRSAIDELKEELAQRQQRRDERGLNAKEALNEMIKESREKVASNNNVVGPNGIAAGSGPGRSAGWVFLFLMFRKKIIIWQKLAQGGPGSVKAKEKKKKKGRKKELRKKD